MSLATIKQDIETKFVAEWSGTTLDKVRFENTQFTPPQNDYWVSLDTVFANSVNAAIHSGLDTRVNGFIIVDCYGPPDDGSRATLNLIDSVNAIFENKQFNGIQCLAARPRHIGIANVQGADPVWYVYRTSIPFYKYV